MWIPHHLGVFDSCIGFNTQLDLCWPMAMQNDMLFDATIAVSRIAYLLSEGKAAADDPFMLYHRGLALARLQKSIQDEAALAESEIIFTVGRLIAIAVRDTLLNPVLQYDYPGRLY